MTDGIRSPLQRGAVRGRPKKPLDLDFEGVLSQSDLAQLAEPSEHATPSEPAQMRDRHHSIARMMALGFPQTQIAAVTGMTASRISVLKDAPAFQELISFYREESGKEFRDFVERMQMLGMEVTGELLGRLSESPDAISNGELRELLKLVADRTGHSPVHKQVSLVGALPPEQMERLKNASKTQETIRFIGSSSSGGAPSDAGAGGPLEGKTPSGSCGEGDDL